MAYYTARDLAREMGQSERTARRVLLTEARLKHERAQWWRFDLDLEGDRAALDELRRVLANPESARRFGCRRRRRRGVECQQLEMF
ncbi:MAG: hypothetical protein KY445_08205 [Armatimonadetes bacterium]|nr:hypothetical protein [Armatimonadota bacterium]